jgi:hypothetical protein
VPLKKLLQVETLLIQVFIDMKSVKSIVEATLKEGSRHIFPRQMMYVSTDEHNGNFVLVAGTAGMSLATVIRLEFAYPGVGILAGDSLQYLSTATAHGVIMVFYMIMPAIFGAFGNFLLPTQLGVHDVAFPRLNSAAF